MKIFCSAVLVSAFFLLGLSACGGDKKNDRFPGYEELPSGTFVKKHKTGKGTVWPSDSDYVFVTLSYTTEKDSVFQSGAGSASPIMVDKARYKGDFFEMIRTLHVGDSVTYMMRVDSMRIVNHITPPAFIDSNGYMGFSIRLDSIVPLKEVKRLMAIEQKAAGILDSIHNHAEAVMPEMKKNDKAMLAKFLKEHNVTVKPEPSGVYYIETQPGNGKKIEAGRSVKVHYKGYFLDGTIFDQSDIVEGRNAPVFQPGAQPLIAGFVEGMLKMSKGAKATIIIPSEQGYQDGITRVFDITIIDVK